MLRASHSESVLAVEVTDSGRGLTEEELRLVFQRFERASADSRTPGAGLGLPISRELARLLGGDLTASSEPGRGSTFRMEVRAPVSERAAEVGTASIGRVRATAGGPPRALVVDDLTDNREVLAGLLVHAGFEVRQAPDADRALPQLGEFRPHALLTDLRMPGAGGLELVRRVKGRTEGAPLVVVVSASAFEGDREGALEAGADAFLDKPVKGRELLRVLCEGLGLERELDDEGPGGPAMDASDLRARVGALPADWRRAVVAGARVADPARLGELAGEVREVDPEVAMALLELTRSYDYDRIRTVWGGEEVEP